MPLKTKFFLLLIALFTLASFNLFAQEDENKKEEEEKTFSSVIKIGSSYQTGTTDTFEYSPSYSLKYTGFDLFEFALKGTVLGNYIVYNGVGASNTINTYGASFSAKFDNDVFWIEASGDKRTGQNNYIYNGFEGETGFNYSDSFSLKGNILAAREYYSFGLIEMTKNFLDLEITITPHLSSTLDLEFSANYSSNSYVLASSNYNTYKGYFGFSKTLSEDTSISFTASAGKDSSNYQIFGVSPFFATYLSDSIGLNLSADFSYYYRSATKGKNALGGAKKSPLSTKDSFYSLIMSAEISYSF